MEEMCIGCGSRDIYRGAYNVLLTNDNRDKITQKVAIYYCGDCGLSDCEVQE